MNHSLRPRGTAGSRLRAVAESEQRLAAKHQPAGCRAGRERGEGAAVLPEEHAGLRQQQEED